MRALSLFLCSAACSTAHAQSFEAVGTRALGMAGAFTAVADDATATYWNPAGLSIGPFFGLAIESARREGMDDEAQGAAWRGTALGVSMMYPALGVSYYRLRNIEIRPSSMPTGAAGGGRQDQGRDGPARASLLSHQLGVTFVQSLLDGLAVGTTLKLVRGVAATDQNVVGGSVGDRLNHAEDLARRGSQALDLDLGVIASLGSVRLGLVARNLREPSFASSLPGGTLALQRQFRVGLAVKPRAAAGPGNGLTIALDSDLTRTLAVEGERRSLAAGAEQWLRRGRLGLRGGLRASTIGPVRLTGAGGASIMVRPGLLVDGQMTRGGTGLDRGWSIAARVTF